MAKTIKQIADELNIDKQKVYRFIKRNHISEAHQTSGVMYYDEAAETLIQSHFNRITTSSEAHHDVHHEAHQMKQSENEQQRLIEHLLDEIRTKNEQLAEKDRQLAAANERLAESQKLIDQEQKLRLINEDKILQLESREQKSWWQKLWGR